MVESEPNQSSNWGDVETLVGKLKVLQTLCEPEEFKKIYNVYSKLHQLLIKKNIKIGLLLQVDFYVLIK